MWDDNESNPYSRKPHVDKNNPYHRLTPISIPKKETKTMTAYSPDAEEKAFLDSYEPKEYPSIGLTADIVALTIRNGEFSVLLIKRGDHPYKGRWALPGGFVNPNETSEEAATRELIEETGIDLDRAHLEQLKTYSFPNRDPRTRVVSTAYLALIPNLPTPEAGDDAAEAHFFAVKDVLAAEDSEDKIHLAFDHEQIIRDGVERAASKLEYTPLATTFLEEPFTLSDVRRVYETVWNTKLHAANFRRKVLSTQGFVTLQGEKGVSQFDTGRVADLYKRGEAELLHPAILRKGVDGKLHDEDVEEGGL
jgi:8-oxo-dGTP diphosphatase